MTKAQVLQSLRYEPGVFEYAPVIGGEILGVVAVYQRGVTPYRRPFFKLAAKHLASNGLALVVISGDEPTPDISTAVRIGEPVYVQLGSHLRKSIRGRDIVEQLVIPRGLWRTLRELNPLLIVTEDLSALPANLQIPAFCALRRRPYLIWTLGPSILGKRRSTYRALFLPIFAMLRRPAAGFICYSRWAAAEMGRIYRKRCFVAPNATVPRPAPIDLEHLPRTGGRGIRALFIGRVTAQKKLDLLLRAAAVASAEIMIDIVGDGEERSPLEELAQQLGIADRVQFHGEIRSAEQKAQLIDRAHVGVMPGLGGLFIQEVQARGCPVIATSADGTEQDLVRAVNPELFLEQADPVSIAQALEKLAVNPALLMKCRSAALAVVREDYNLEAMAREWTAAVTSVLRTG